MSNININNKKDQRTYLTESEYNNINTICNTLISSKKEDNIYSHMLQEIIFIDITFPIVKSITNKIIENNEIGATLSLLNTCYRIKFNNLNIITLSQINGTFLYSKLIEFFIKKINPTELCKTNLTDNIYCNLFCFLYFFNSWISIKDNIISEIKDKNTTKLERKDSNKKIEPVKSNNISQKIKSKPKLKLIRYH